MPNGMSWSDFTDGFIAETQEIQARVDSVLPWLQPREAEEYLAALDSKRRDIAEAHAALGAAIDNGTTKERKGAVAAINILGRNWEEYDDLAKSLARALATRKGMPIDAPWAEVEAN